MLFCNIRPYINYAYIFTHHIIGEWTYARNCRLVYFISGNYTIHTVNASYTMEPDSLFFLAGYEKYRVEANMADVIVLNFYTDCRYAVKNELCAPIATTLEEPIHNEVEAVNDCEYLNTSLYLDNAYKYKCQIRDIAEEYSKKQIFYQEKCDSMLKALLSNMYRESLQTNRGMAEAVTKTISEITRNVGKKANCKELAAKAGYHEYHLNRLFLKYTGLSLYNYILTFKINESRNLLENTNYSITDIAEAVGFCSTAHFSAYFKQTIGMTSNTYRKKMKNLL